MSSSKSASMTQIWSGTCYLTPLIGAFIAGLCPHVAHQGARRQAKAALPAGTPLCGGASFLLPHSKACCTSAESVP